jgi:uncharacterized protein (DUF433 family)
MAVSRKAAITRRPGYAGGSPAIDGTRIRVSSIIRYKEMYEAEGLDWLVETLKALPHLNSDQVEAAMHFYAENKAEIDVEIAEEDAIHERARKEQARRPST